MFYFNTDTFFRYHYLSVPVNKAAISLTSYINNLTFRWGWYAEETPSYFKHVFCKNCCMVRLFAHNFDVPEKNIVFKPELCTRIIFFYGCGSYFSKWLIRKLFAKHFSLFIRIRCIKKKNFRHFDSYSEIKSSHCEIFLCTAFSLFWSCSLFYSFSIFLLASHPVSEMPLKRKKKPKKWEWGKKRENY